MAIYPKATVSLLPENDLQPPIVPTQVIFHTAVDHPGPSDLPAWFARPDVTVESHFWVSNHGDITQMMDTEVRADANLAANIRAISIETEDDGDPEGNPWTIPQLQEMAELGVWLALEHDIPAQLIETHDGPGFGWHSMFGFTDPYNLIGPIPNPWTPSLGKTCPGSTRIRQFVDVLLPAIQKGLSTPDLSELDKAKATHQRLRRSIDNKNSKIRALQASRRILQQQATKYQRIREIVEEQ